MGPRFLGRGNKIKELEGTVAQLRFNGAALFRARKWLRYARGGLPGAKLQWGRAF